MVFLCLCMCSSAEHLIAQEANKVNASNAMSHYALKQWSTEHGLPSNNVTGIVRLANDYVWMSTFDGLVRFDGMQFDQFKIQEGVSDQTNQIITLSRFQNSLFVSVRNSGLFRFNNSHFFEPIGAEELKNYTINAIQPASDRLWLGTDRGLAYYKEGTDRKSVV